jgi:hypothetical protein
VGGEAFAVDTSIIVADAHRRRGVGKAEDLDTTSAGSTFAPVLVDHPIDLDGFRAVVLGGRINGNSVMKGFAGDPNVVPYVNDIYAYLRARAEHVLGRGCPAAWSWGTDAASGLRRRRWTDVRSA